jgi:hypothetical protein
MQRVGRYVKLVAKPGQGNVLAGQTLSRDPD